MKSIHEPIDVEAHDRMPRRFRWQDRTYHVRRLLDYWILQTRWWGREEKRIYYRLETHRAVVEIYRAEEIVRSSRHSTGAATNPLPDPRTDRPPLPIEGDTHTRERRRTDAAYRPDVPIQERARREAAAKKISDTEHRLRWVLSKILD